MKKGAILSESRQYRYQLWRIWDDEKPKVLFIMHNPSKADEDENDPTITRCINFAKSWGYGGIYVGNISPYIATKPAELNNVSEPDLFPRSNILNILWMAEKCQLHVLAYGVPHKKLKNWPVHTYDLNHVKFHAIHKTKNGYPGHPLYLKADLKPKLY